VGDRSLPRDHGRRKKALRLLAWQLQPQAGSEYPATFERAYDCARDCSGKRAHERRRGRGCTRSDLPPISWEQSARELYQLPTVNHADGDGVHWLGHGTYFGRHPDRKIEGSKELGIPVYWEHPIEPAADGCPAGWARSPYVDSVWRYVRRRTQDGNRVPNPFFDRAPWQVQEAAMTFEDEQERWQSYRQEVDADRWRRADEEARRKRGAR